MEQDWIWGFFGGGIIGLVGVVLLLGNGMIMGVSGIIGVGLVFCQGVRLVWLLEQLVYCDMSLLVIFGKQMVYFLVG